MDELTKMISQRLGVEEAIVKKAIGAVLTFCQKQAAAHSFDFDNKILSHLKGADELMKDKEAVAVARDAPKAGSGGGLVLELFKLALTVLKTFGIITMLKQFLASTFGDSAVKMIESVENGAELATIMNQFGIDQEKGVQMVRMLMDFLKDKVDPDTVKQLTEQIPAFQAFMGSDKKEE